ncbi:MAG TPA: iron-containing redox enzyme family protein, partial [Myxococcales bacterium]|nr:iron-containing redox enzyme family protein [Myxococcales bacterium]
MEAIALAAPVDPRALHLLLARFNQRRLRPSLPCASWREELREEAMLRELEGDFVESERSSVAERARTAPSDPDAFVRWFEDLRETGPGQGDPLFPWLKASASLADMRWFLDQE